MVELRKAAEMALEALNQATGMCAERTSTRKDVDEAIKALRQALAQPEQDDEAYGYAKYLAECIWKKHYKEESPHWRPADNTLSVLTQIDNMTCGLEKAQPNTTPDSATRSADSADSFCKQELHNLMSVAGRMALELECLLLDTENLSVVSKWWDTGMEALQAYRHYVWSVTHGKDGEHFCDTHCVHTDHHPDCELAQPEQEPVAWLDSDGFPWSKEGVECRSVKDTYTPLYAGSPPIKEQQPVAWRYKIVTNCWTYSEEYPNKELAGDAWERWNVTPLYTAPPSKPWVSLTDEEIDDLDNFDYDGYSFPNNLARAIEAKLKEKNNV